MDWLVALKEAKKNLDDVVSLAPDDIVDSMKSAWASINTLLVKISEGEI